ncbi:MAG TPA: transglutaminase family protein [Polyangiaceae bacterium]|jgi:transglutaminase-like putative cysteine protease|nr:transglutaminase family protein [Polyangiaceae bacterium]
MKLRVVHKTTYHYAEAVPSSHHEAHLAPREVRGQQVLSHAVHIAPRPDTTRERRDYFQNRALYFGIHESHRSLEVVAESEILVGEREHSMLLDKTAWETARDVVTHDRQAEPLIAYEFVFPSPYVGTVHPELAAFARPSFGPRRPLLDAVAELTARIHEELTYDTAATEASTPLRDVIHNRRGVCQDFAHFQIGCLRAMGLPARYVSGYLSTLPPTGKPRLVGCDASHAWVSTYLPNVGWVDFDPVNDMVPGDRHVTVAYGRDYGDVTPIRGVLVGGGRHSVRVAVDVAPVAE